MDGSREMSAAIVREVGGCLITVGEGCWPLSGVLWLLYNHLAVLFNHAAVL